MSRIGKLPIEIPSGVTITIEDGKIIVTNPKGTLEVPHLSELDVKNEEGQIVVTRKNDERVARAQHGLQRTLINNAIIGLKAQYKQPQQIFAKQYQIQFERENGTYPEEKNVLEQTANILGQVYVDARKNQLSENSCS